MKKFIGFLFLITTLTGCATTNLLNTPTKRVEMFFSKYQSLDDDVLEQLNTVVDDKISFTDEQRQDYIEVMKKHYQALKYEIKDETIDGDTAVVTTEIEVVDYSRILTEADTYLEANPEEFNDENGEYSETVFNEYRIDKLKEAEDKVKYTIDIYLTKIGDEWVIDDLDSDTADKIQGIYEY